MSDDEKEVCSLFAQGFKKMIAELREGIEEEVLEEGMGNGVDREGI